MLKQEMTKYCFNVMPALQSVDSHKSFVNSVSKLIFFPGSDHHQGREVARGLDRMRVDRQNYISIDSLAVSERTMRPVAQAWPCPANMSKPLTQC